MPKVDLHCHLDGSLRPATMLELSEELGIALPRSDIQSLRAYMRADGVSGLEEYLARFEMTIALLQTPDVLERAAYELVQDAHMDGIIYMEVRNAPKLSTRGGLTLDEVMQATLRGLARGERQFGVQTRFIVCSLRHWMPEVSLQMAQLAVRYQEQGVVAFDLAGAESGHPAAVHVEAFMYAHAHGLHLTCHAGEGAGAGSVAQAVYLCGAQRVGHGVRAAEDPILLQYLIDRQIPLEMCPTSNVQTCAVASYGEHPLRRYYEAGIPVTINTDNRLISGTTLTDEFLHVAHHLGFTVRDLAACVENGCRAAFLPEKDRELLLKRARSISEPGSLR
jgi:adenosine deaminase